MPRCPACHGDVAVGAPRCPTCGAGLGWPPGVEILDDPGRPGPSDTSAEPSAEASADSTSTSRETAGVPAGRAAWRDAGTTTTRAPDHPADAIVVDDAGDRSDDGRPRDLGDEQERLDDRPAPDPTQGAAEARAHPRRSPARVLLVVAMLAILAVPTYFVTRWVAGLREDDGSNALAAYAAGTGGVEFVAPDGDFRAVFPDDPVHATRRGSDAQGTYAVEEFRASTGSSNYAQISYFDQLDATLTPDQVGRLLVANVEALADELGGQLERGEPMQFLTLMALDSTITYDDGGEQVVLHGRTVAVGGRVYTIVLAAHDDPQAAFDRFVGSFQLLAPGDPRSGSTTSSPSSSSTGSSSS